MKKLYFLLSVIIVVFILTQCQLATEDTIVGKWKGTHALCLSIDGDYYQFKSDGTYSRDPDKGDLYETTAYANGTYDLDGSGNLTLSKDLSNSKWTVYLSGNIMYWYLYGIEAIRFSRQ